MKKIKKKKLLKRSFRSLSSMKKPLKNTSSTFRFEKTPEKNSLDLNEILHDLLNLFTKAKNSLSDMEKDEISRNLSSKLIETLDLIDKTLKQEYSNFNRDSLLNLLKEGYGKYIGIITKIFETHKEFLDEIFMNFNQKFCEIYDKIKDYFFQRYKNRNFNDIFIFLKVFNVFFYIFLMVF